MKKILSYISNKSYEETLERFSEEEKFNLSVCTQPDSIDIKPYLLFITDEPKVIENIIGDKSSVCLITDDKPDRSDIFYIKSTFSAGHIRLVIDAIHHGSLINNYVPSLIPKIFIKEYIVGNDYYNVDRIACAMTYELALYFSFSTLEKVRIGLSEILTNSIEHGNLGISNAEKTESTENGTFYKMIDDKIKDKRLANKKTYVRIEFDSGELIIIVKDEGKGFDTKKIPNPTDPEGVLKLHGRGILIATMYFDSVNYNDIGNEVTLRKSI